MGAEIPIGDDEKELREIVEKCMMHGPCGALNPKCVCMYNGICTKKYPKDFRDETEWCANGYPLYRRREFVDGNRVAANDGVRDNRWVVPYNKVLCGKFRCHINVEICTSIKAVKYLYKYSYKGPDRASLQKEFGRGHRIP